MLESVFLSDTAAFGVTEIYAAQRRRKLMDPLPDGAVVIVCGARIKYMTQSILCVPICPARLYLRTSSSYKFRQATDFFYLTGFLEPDAVAVLR